MFRILSLVLFLVAVSALEHDDYIRKDELIECFHVCTPERIIQMVDYQDLRKLPSCLDWCLNTNTINAKIQPIPYVFNEYEEDCLYNCSSQWAFREDKKGQIFNCVPDCIREKQEGNRPLNWAVTCFMLMLILFFSCVMPAIG